MVHTPFYFGGKRYINEVRLDTTFDTSNPDMLATLVKWAPDFGSNPFSSINCIFEEESGSGFLKRWSTFSSFASFLAWVEKASIKVVALRDIKAGEELFINYCD